MAAITFVAPYQSMGELAKSISKEYDWPVEVVVGRAVRGLELARDAVRRGSRVIVTRGITAERIRANLDIPVVEVQVTGFDMLRAYLQARKLGTPVGVADDKRIIEGFKCLSEILSEEIHTYELNDERDMRRAVETLRRAGVKTIIGKVTLNRLLKAYKLQGVLIPSGRESVIRALEEALRVLSVRQQEMAKFQEMKAVLDFNSEGIVAFDADKTITAFNPVAARLLGRAPEEAIGQQAGDVFPPTLMPIITRVWHTGQAGLGELLALGSRQGSRQAVINCIPVLVEGRVKGMVITMQDARHLQKMEQKIRRNLGSHGHVARYSFADIIGESEVIRETIKKAKKYGEVDSTVLIYGETGCGKEIFAQAIHGVSSRREGPFVAINCAALPENLLESELFGYVEGAFTGARKGGKSGLFELAHNGTLFLDEIGEMSERLQARVLRVLEEGQVMRLGADRLLPVDVRIIAATNRDLQQMVQDKTFREDLYYRIHVLTLKIPPLRERQEDIALLLDYFITKYCRKFNKNIHEVEAGVIELLKCYHWPGNVRELKNTAERLVLLTEGTVLTEAKAREILQEQGFHQLDLHVAKDDSLEKAEQLLIEKVLRETGGNRSEAARRLGIGRTTLWRKLKEKKK
ncbi:MAG: sigma 54-interacting transcriptional regulator, partial [Clostridia bacterium]|nr:sigma 54-interacting transcriptional regulator [Clostridia bacterium]